MTLGAPIDRVDAIAKVTGKATYAAETEVSRVAHAVIVGSEIARGALRSIDIEAARNAAGVIAVLAPGRAPKLAPYQQDPKHPADRILQLLQDDKILYADQPIAVVVADTLEHAQYAAGLVRAKYRADPVAADIATKLDTAVEVGTMGPNGKSLSSRGDAVAALAKAAVKIEATYTTPVQNHNPMEPHATIAVWRGDDHLTLYDATQGIFGVRDKIAKIFELPTKNVRVIDKYVGGGFGCKGAPWSHVALAALAARAVKRPVKLAITRSQMFALVGHRPHTIQKVALAADARGALLAVRHDTISETSTFDKFAEPCGLTARHLYRCANVATSHKLVAIDIPTPTFQRAPGEASGSFALESAMDELAYAVALDPLELRLRNHAEMDDDEGKPYSSKSLKECYARAAERFGWAKRKRAPGSMTDGKMLVGWGMATATYPSKMSPASARATLVPGGTLLVEAGTQDIGTGTYTIMTQIAADIMDLPVEQVRFELGDTELPETPVSGGSQTAASTGSAVKKACLALKEKVAAARRGGESLAEIAARGPITAEVKSELEDTRKQYSTHAFGCDFVEVRVDPDTREVRVSKIVAAFAAGKILNMKTATSQFHGGIVWGIGLALEEATVRDRRTARAVTRDLADYHVPVHADVPDIDVISVDEVDPYVSAIGAKGIGEIGITGVGAAIANAVYHATGKRIRDLPITLDKLL